MDPAGPSFPGVHYNDKKIDKGIGELMLMKNFPSFINESSSKEKVRNYLRAISIGNKKILKPQFHAMISTKLMIKLVSEICYLEHIFFQSFFF